MSKVRALLRLRVRQQLPQLVAQATLIVDDSVQTGFQVAVPIDLVRQLLDAAQHDLEIDARVVLAFRGQSCRIAEPRRAGTQRRDRLLRLFFDRRVRLSGERHSQVERRPVAQDRVPAGVVPRGEESSCSAGEVALIQAFEARVVLSARSERILGRGWFRRRLVRCGRRRRAGAGILGRDLSRVPRRVRHRDDNERTNNDQEPAQWVEQPAHGRTVPVAASLPRPAPVDPTHTAATSDSSAPSTNHR